VGEFVDRVATHIAELNAIHPFREGNGRTLRALLFLLGRQAGHEVMPERIDPQAWNRASRESFRSGDPASMREVIGDAVRPG
jgi:cell filamentation protein, protein adenylyltransferase